MKRWILLGLASFFMVSCVQTEMRDSSGDPKFRHIVGQTFRIKRDLLVIGVTAEKNYARQLDYLVLVPEPGFSGPEVVTKGRLGSDAVIRVDRVLTAKSSLVSRVIYVVQRVDIEKPFEAEARVLVTGEVSDGNYGLDRSIYERTK